MQVKGLSYKEVVQAFHTFFKLMRTVAKERKLSVTEICPPKVAKHERPDNIFALSTDQVNMIVTKAKERVANAVNVNASISIGKKKVRRTLDKTIQTE